MSRLHEDHMAAWKFDRFGTEPAGYPNAHPATPKGGTSGQAQGSGGPAPVTCNHSVGFTDLRPVGEGVAEGRCLGCGEFRFIDRRGDVYRDLGDARRGVNRECGRGAS